MEQMGYVENLRYLYSKQILEKHVLYIRQTVTASFTG